MSLTQQNHSRFYELDFMRFLAALAVLFYHYTFSATRLLGTPSFGFAAISKYGYLGVDAFFMISGYVVLMSSMHKSPKYFIVSRITRLYPAYLVCCFLTFIILYFNKISVAGVPQVTFKLLAYNLTMFQEFFGKANINGIFWTLTYELGFYTIVLLIAALKLWKNLLPLLGMWLIYTLFINYSEINAFSFFLIPKYSPCFIAGMLFYLLRVNYTLKWKIHALLLLCLAVNIKNNIQITKEMNVFYHADNEFNRYIVFAFTLFFFLIFLLSALKKLNFTFLIYPAKLGVLTYPLYLVHGFGIGFFTLLGGKVNKYVLFTSATLFSIGLSFIIYKFVEKKYSRQLKILLSNLFDKL